LRGVGTARQRQRGEDGGGVRRRGEEAQVGGGNKKTGVGKGRTTQTRA